MKVRIEKDQNLRVKIEQTSIQRDWMNETDNRHAYKCFPVSLANTIGWSVSYLDDIEFIWDGISDSTDKHVKILKAAPGICSTQRANATISFYTGIFFKTDENTSMLQIVPPNYFIDGATPFTTVISTSFFEDAYPVAWRITRPNTIIRIPAGTPIATFIPISLGALSDLEVEMHDKIFDQSLPERKAERLKVWSEISSQGKFTNFYRDAVDYDGTMLGKHEKKSLNLNIKDYTTKRMDD
jgi:hypothetical protein